MKNGLFKKLGLLASALVLTTSLAACGSSNKTEIVEEVEVPQSEEVMEPQSGSAIDFPLEGSFLANTADPENTELSNACLQLQNNLNALEQPLGDIDVEMFTVPDSSEERKELDADYLKLFGMATTSISNQEVVDLWTEHTANLGAMFAGIEAGDTDAIDAALDKFEATSDEVTKLCFTETPNE